MDISAANQSAFDDVLKTLGVDKLSEEKKEEMISKISELVLKRVFLATLEELDDEGKEKYEQLIGQNTDPEEMSRFLNSRIPDYSRFTEKVIAELGEEIKKDLTQ